MVCIRSWRLTLTPKQKCFIINKGWNESAHSSEYSTIISVSRGRLNRRQPLFASSSGRFLRARRPEGTSSTADQGGGAGRCGTPFKPGDRHRPGLRTRSAGAAGIQQAFLGPSVVGKACVSAGDAREKRYGDTDDRVPYPVGWDSNFAGSDLGALAQSAGHTMRSGRSRVYRILAVGAQGPPAPRAGATLSEALQGPGTGSRLRLQQRRNCCCFYTGINKGEHIWN